jgi:hypothetical protein
MLNLIDLSDVDQSDEEATNDNESRSSSQNNGNMYPKNRLKRSEITEAEWIQHKKQRKKIASAKWYLKKKAKLDEKRRKKEMKSKHIYGSMVQATDEKCRNRQAVYMCDMEYKMHGWAPRPDNIPAVDYLELIRIARQAVDNMKLDPIKDSVRINLCRGLALSELKNEYLQSSSDIQAVRDKCKMSGQSDTNSSSSVSSSASSWVSQSKVAKALLGSVFPTVCTGAGLAFVNAIIRSRSSLPPSTNTVATNWASALSSWYKTNTQNNNMLPIRDIVRDNTNEINNPTKNEDLHRLQNNSPIQ